MQWSTSSARRAWVALTWRAARIALLMAGSALLMATAVHADPPRNAAPEVLTIDAYLPSYRFEIFNDIARELARLSHQDGKLRVNFVVGRDRPGDLAEQLGQKNRRPERPMIILSRDKPHAATAMSFVRGASVPVVFLNYRPELEIFSQYANAWYIGTERDSPGHLQAEMLKVYLRTHHDWDRNRNGKLDVVLIGGNLASQDYRSRKLTLLNSLHEMSIEYRIVGDLRGHWDRETAHHELIAGLLNHDFALGDIEAIVCQNDNMALGALDWLQEHQLNLKGDPQPIPVLGIDGLRGALVAVAQGRMLGTVRLDVETYARTALRLIKTLARNPGAEPDDEFIGLSGDDEYAYRIPYIPVNQLAAIKLAGFIP